MLRLTQALLALRREVPALGNARRDLLTVRHDDEAKTLGILRRDVTATPALFALNFSERAAACPLPERAQALSLELYSRDARFGHDAAVPPLGVVEPGAESVTLPPLSAAIWL